VTQVVIDERHEGQTESVAKLEEGHGLEVCEQTKAHMRSSAMQTDNLPA
jgi:hypothetical protein